MGLDGQHIDAGNKMHGSRPKAEVLEGTRRAGIVGRLVGVTEMPCWPHVGTGDLDTVEVGDKAVIVINPEDQLT